jgi:hypothetical protein
MKLPAWMLLLAVGSAIASSPAPAASYAVQQRHVPGGGGGWDYLSIDAASHHLFIARDGRVMVVYARHGKLPGDIPGMSHGTVSRWYREAVAAMSAMARATASA